jgi:hypothetical protein
MSERGPFTRDGFAKLLKAAAPKAAIENVRPHALTAIMHKRNIDVSGPRGQRLLVFSF